MMRSKLSCQACPAKNKRVTDVMLGRTDGTTRVVRLCEECRRVAGVMAAEEAARAAARVKGDDTSETN